MGFHASDGLDGFRVDDIEVEAYERCAWVPVMDSNRRQRERVFPQKLYKPILQLRVYDIWVEANVRGVVCVGTSDGFQPSEEGEDIEGISPQKIYKLILQLRVYDIW